MTSSETPGVDLFVIGAMKAATTGLCDWLGAQEGITLSQPKEPCIFVSDSAVRDWLARDDMHFAHGSPGSLRVDGSTDYTKFPSIAGVPERVSRHCPQARFVYMMRHPIARLESQYRFEWMLGGDKLPMEQAIAGNPQLIDNGRYAFQLRQWLDWFPPDRFVLVFAEAFARDPAAQVGRVVRELSGDDEMVISTPHEARSNETSQLVRRSARARRFRRSPVGRLARGLVPGPVVDWHHRRLQVRSRPEISSTTRASLESVFDDDLLDLGRLTSGPGISCSTWDDTAARWDPVLRPS